MSEKKLRIFRKFIILYRNNLWLWNFLKALVGMLYDNKILCRKGIEDYHKYFFISL
jgi:hypothetical protein